ncbi:MAG: sulfate permease [Armatimonadetes bacterium]|nr:sulfate permease [Armatimonadota bacterium]
MIARAVPAVDWMRRYRRGDLSGDIVAGLTTGVMLVPQAMAYAMLAGLPPSVGLYASTVPLIVYTLFGSSRQLAVGPVAIVSLLVASGVSELAEAGTPEYLGYAALLALMVGVLQFTFGLLRLGMVANFISHAVVTGFTSAAALVILLSQVKHLLGVKLEQTESTLHLISELVTSVPQTNLLTFTVGAGAIAGLAVLRARSPRFPASMLVVILGTLATWALGLSGRGVAIVGHVPAGLPSAGLPPMDVEAAAKLLPVALTILFVGFMESIAVAEMIAARERYKVDANRELVALGLGNVASGLISGYPVTGGFSRTAVNYQSGAKTGLASVVTAAVVVLTVLFLTPLFHYLPHAVLASVVVVAVVGLIDVRGMRQLFRVKVGDGIVAIVTFLVTLSVNVEVGIVSGVVLSLLQFIWRSSHPHIAELGYVESEDAYLNVSRFPDAIRFPEAILLRVDAALYFANMAFVENRLRRRLADRTDARWVVLDLSGVNDIDASAVYALQDIMESHRDLGITFVFAGMKGPVRDVVARAGWDDRFGRWKTCHALPDALAEIGLSPGKSG